MKILLHTCCGPCTIYPLKILRDKGHSIAGYFYNPNIHPYKEFKIRLDTYIQYAHNVSLESISELNYGLTEYLQKVVFNEKIRCDICYSMRLEHVAAYAAQNKFDAFTTTLLYSRYQNHKSIINTCLNLSSKKHIEFFYHDFREGWHEGIIESKSLDMYRQHYCGCIYSEQERYDKSLRKKAVK